MKRLIQPDPRDLDEITWCKLTYAAATLTEEDYAASWSYPLSYYRAVALLWVTSARRANEIRRLRIGCIRRDWDPEMLNEHGVPVLEHHAPTGATQQNEGSLLGAHSSIYSRRHPNMGTRATNESSKVS